MDPILHFRHPHLPFELNLFCSGAAFWEEKSTLFLADLHLGKETSFQARGVPVPSGPTARKKFKRSFDRFRASGLGPIFAWSRL